MARIGLGSLRATPIYCLVYPIALLPCLSPAAPFTVVVLPDTQFYSQSFPEQFRAQTHWIVDNRAAENIVLVSHVGDIVQNGGQGPARNAAEWNNADAAMNILDNNAQDLPYGVVLGNHGRRDQRVASWPLLINIIDDSRFSLSPILRLTGQNSAVRLSETKKGPLCSDKETGTTGSVQSI